MAAGRQHNLLLSDLIFFALLYPVLFYSIYMYLLLNLIESNPISCPYTYIYAKLSIYRYTYMSYLSMPVCVFCLAVGFWKLVYRIGSGAGLAF